MKKLIIGTFLATLLFTGCSEDEALKNAKIQFERDTVTLGYMKAKEVAEASHKEEIVQSWIEDLKTKNKWFTYEQVKNEIMIRNKKGYLNLGVLETDYYPKYGKELVNNILIEIDVTWAKILNGK